MIKMQNNTRSIEILLIEDNIGDVFLTQEAFGSHKLTNTLTVVNDGEKGMEYLLKAGDYADAKTPDLVLLDINLPKKDGKQIIKEMKNDDVLKSMPVIVLTSSESERDILVDYGLDASNYMIKPITLGKLLNIVKMFDNFEVSIGVPAQNNSEPD